MNTKKLFSITLIFVILASTSVVFATDDIDWNGISFTVPDGFSTGTPGADKIGMMYGKQSIVLENHSDEKFNELKEESEPKENKTYKIDDTEVTEYVFERELANVHFLTFTKDGKQYDIIYKDITATDEEEEPTEENTTENNTTENNTTENNTTEDNATDTNTTDENATQEDNASEDTFNVTSDDNPVNIIIKSIKTSKQ
ncbi:MAG: hypothetical protein BZ136_07790 [Methanosphaera sp. rholeuAM74]|nr:MAG: hypothetical protein BZ136_07790 [Methanosphaera sp. rholeuAM74]